jgi:carboxylate-amine ligase
MIPSLTLGIEQEFQLVNPETGELCSCSHTILEKGRRLLGEHLKPESKQSCIELVTGICSTIEEARREVSTLTMMLKEITEQENVSLISAGTHPSSSWQEQKTTPGRHYEALEEEFQDLERMLVIYGMHIHVGLKQKELLIPLMNQVRSWLPHLLALSSNSPFWSGRSTGLKSFRSALWRMVPHTGLPKIMTSWEHFEHYLKQMTKLGCIESGHDLCWDVRPHPTFHTLEFRICDMPASSRDTLALAALCQGLVMKLHWLSNHQCPCSSMPRSYLEENKWQAMRYGLDATIIDSVRGCRLPMRDALHALLDFVDDVVDDLGSRQEMNYLRSLIDDPAGTGADRQLAVYQQTHDVKQVTQYLLQQTRKSCSALHAY